MGSLIDTDEMGEAAERVGTTLRDKWHLDALIDVGGMAAVYAATHRNGMRGAVKILHRHRSSDPNVAARFRREGYIANKVAHPNSVSVLDDDVDDGSVFLVMELLEGSTLRERAASYGGKLSPEEVLLAADKVLDVLAMAHDASIVHRDVKPDNVFVTTDGRVKVLDFGIAGLPEGTGPDRAATLAGLPMGTPAFMSPEQARGRWDLVGPQSDLWSLGATMFTLLSGEQVHTEETVLELLSAVFNKPARSLAEVLPGCHPGLAEIVDRALQLHLADRWPDARAMQTAVRAVHREIYGASLPPVTLEPRPPFGPGRRADLHASGARHATTVTRMGLPSQRLLAWRVGLAAAFIGAAALGIVQVGRRVHPAETAVATAPVAMATTARLVTATAPTLVTPTPAADPVAPLRDAEVPPAPTPRRRPAALQITRPAHSSIYDRRF